MKNLCTTHWQVGKFDWLHNLHVTNMSTCDIPNINTFESKPFNHFFSNEKFGEFSQNFIKIRGRTNHHHSSATCGGN
jgi:hypothetical protein